MRVIQKISGASAPVDAEIYVQSEIGAALAKIPAWVTLISPLYADDVDKKVKELVKPVVNLEVVLGSPMPTVNLDKTVPNLPLFNPIDGSIYHLNPNVAFPSDNWSVVFVAQPSVKSEGDVNVNPILAGKVHDSEPSNLTPKIAFSRNTNNLVVFSGGAPQNEPSSGYRLNFTNPTPMSDELAVYLVTGSSKNGIVIYKNGVRVASRSTAEAKQPWNTQTGAGEWNILRGARGKFGEIGVLAIDLSDELNANYRETIFNYLMTKYPITLPSSDE